MSACVLDGAVPVHIAQLAKAAAVRVIGRIRETIDDHRVIVAVEHLAYPAVQLIVGNRGPEGGLRIADLCHITHRGIQQLATVIGIVGIAVLRGTVGGRRCSRQTVIRRIGIGVDGTRTAHRCVASAQAVRVESTVRVAHVVRHTGLGHVVELQHRVSWCVLRVARNENWRENWTLYALVVVRIDADLLLLGAKGILAQLEGLQFVVRLQIGPAPHAAVDHMRQTLAMGDLKSRIKLVGYLVYVIQITRNYNQKRN